MRFNNVLVIDSVYSLLVYLVIFHNHKDNTLYIMSEGVNYNIRRKLKNTVYFRRGGRGLFDFFIKIFCNRKLRAAIFDKHKHYYYGHDHLFFSSPFINKFTIIEDGLSNYCLSRRKLPTSILIPNKISGDDDRVKKILLSGIKDIPSKIKNKVELFSLKESWALLPTILKDSINDLFDFDGEGLELGDAILFTQPLSEDGFISESEKIRIYQNIVDRFKDMKIIIKPHPREATDYSKALTGCYLVDGQYPAELIYLNSSSINTVITIFSTAIYTFSGCRRIFIGTEDYPSLREKVGIYSNCEIK